MQYFNPITTLVPTVVERIKDELTARHFYTNLANYADITGFTKAAAFFRAEAESEGQHALVLINYLNGWNIAFNMPSTEGVYRFESLADGIQQAYTMEANLYQQYEGSSNRAMTVDVDAFHLFMDMLKIQREAVAEYRTILDKLALTNDMLIFEDAAFG